MKKIIASFLFLNIFFINCSFANAVNDNLVEYLDKNLKIQQTKTEPIIDNFVLNTLNPNLKIKKEKEVQINDDLVEYLDKNLTIKQINNRPIVDSLALNLDKSQKNISNLKYDGDKIKVSPSTYYTTRKNLFEGKIIEFILAEDISFNNKTYKKGTTIKARIETLSQNGAYGVPADLVVGNFTLPDNFVLQGNITKQGANRALWVYPTSYLLTFFFGLGLLFLPIRGGHVKLKPKKFYNVEI